jgi:hypothetical protein
MFLFDFCLFLYYYYTLKLQKCMVRSIDEIAKTSVIYQDLNRIVSESGHFGNCSKSIGVPLEGIAIILGVERILDMCRSVVNVTGDASCALVVASTEGQL